MASSSALRLAASQSAALSPLAPRPLACVPPAPGYIGPLRAASARHPIASTPSRSARARFGRPGPRIEAEKMGRKTIVHNYGHGGTGWSLSWGSSTLALRHVLATREREIAVIGCGALGLDVSAAGATRGSQGADLREGASARSALDVRHG